MIKADWIGKKIIHKEITGSTNQDIKELAMQGAAEGIVVCADMQSAGRGRRGRSWLSEKGDSLLFSMLLRPDIAPDKASQITLLMALAVTRSLRECYGFEAMIKWPNDILINEKKVCGILTEMNLNKTEIASIIIGSGVNVNQENFPEEISAIATSLKIGAATVEPQIPPP